MADARDNRIDYLEIPAKDLKATQTFFTELFGWQFEDYGPEYTSFEDGRLSGGFFKSEATVSVATGSPLIVFYFGELARTRDKVVSLGGTISRDIFPFPGGKRFHFLDPNGNEYAVWSES